MMRPELATPSSGQMTAVMRAAVRPRGPKSLRIAIVQGGKVIEERLIPPGEKVTVGTAEHNTFVVVGEGVPASLALFEVVRGTHCLNALPRMSGRIADENGVSELSSILGTAPHAGHNRPQPIPLGEGARGRVTVGDVAFLFELRAQPVVSPRPQLPTSVKSGIEIDWQTTVIAALSFLFHFGVVGSIYSDWLDPIVDDKIDVAQIIETVKALPNPPEVENKNEPIDASANAAPRPATNPSRATAAKTPGKAQPAANDRGGDKATSDKKATQISEDLRSLDVAMQTVLNGGGASTDTVLKGSDLPLSMLDQAAAANVASGSDRSEGLRLGDTSGRVGRPGENAQGLQTLAHTGHGDAVADGGHVDRPKAPSGSVSVAGGQPRVGHVPGAESVVAGMAPGFRRCYNKGLLDDATMKGSVRILAKIGPNGDVVSATPSGASGSLSGAVISCVVARVGSAHFSPPDDGGATLEIPASFQTQ